MKRLFARMLPLALVAIATATAAAAAPEQLVLTLAPIDADATEELVWVRGRAYYAHEASQDSRCARRTEACPPCEEAEEEHPRPPDVEFFAYLAVVVLCITTAGLAAGCTMGILSLDPLTLRLKQMEGSPEDRGYAEAVLPVLSSHHDLLVSLLLVNAAANEALPIFLDRLVSPMTAILLSVTCVLVFGEILPSAVMTGPAQLRIAAALAPSVRFLMMFTSPISWPMARLLDLVLGHHDGVTRFKRNEFKALVRMQARTKGWRNRAHAPSVAAAGPSASAAATAAGGGGAPAAINVGTSTGGLAAAMPPSPKPKTPTELRRQLSGVLEKTRAEKSQQGKRTSERKAEADAETDFSEDEVTILTAVFSLQSKRVVHLLEPGRNDWPNIRMIGTHEKMELSLMQLITQWGVSRLPIYSERKNNIRGILLIKEQLVLDPDDKVPVASLRLRRPCLMDPSTSMFDALNVFQTGHSHMALITPHATEIAAAWNAGTEVPEHVTILGICTIEDVIEELIGEEVLDETDNPSTPGEQLAAQGGSGGVLESRSSRASHSNREGSPGSDLKTPLLPPGSAA